MAATEPPTDKLSEDQRACLRRVFDHMSSKDIARELDVSPHTVDQRLKVAMRTLGVDSRVKAAQILAESEQNDPYQRLVYQRPDIAEPALPASEMVPADQAGTHDDHAELTMREAQLPYQAFAPATTQGLTMPFPAIAGEKNDLTAIARLGWIAGIAFASALAFGAILTGLEALTRLT